MCEILCVCEYNLCKLTMRCACNTPIHAHCNLQATNSLGLLLVYFYLVLLTVAATAAAAAPRVRSVCETGETFVIHFYHTNSNLINFNIKNIRAKRIYFLSMIFIYNFKVYCLFTVTLFVEH